jgi:hypothetical protein
MLLKHKNKSTKKGGIQRTHPQHKTTINQKSEMPLLTTARHCTVKVFTHLILSYRIRKIVFMFAILIDKNRIICISYMYLLLKGLNCRNEIK